VPKLELGSWWTWTYRALAAAAAITMFLSFKQPWWTASITSADANIPLPLEAIKVYGWGLRHALVTLETYIKADETPAYQTTLAWVYLGVSAAIVIAMAWFKGWWSKALMALVGFIYIGYAWTAIYKVVATRLTTYSADVGGFMSPIKTVGDNYLSGGYVKVTGVLTSAYTLAYIAGGLCIILAILGLFIKVKSRTVTRTTAPGT
jgi:hypothetical protein